MLVEFLRTQRRENALTEASIVAVECVLRLVTVNDRVRQTPQDGELVESMREALAAARACVVATTCALWTIDGDQRLRGQCST